IFAYCWMTNHLHLAVRVGDTPLARPMQRLAMRYALHIHRDAGQAGHLFERRYRAILVDADSYLLALVRYIHLNPVVAGMVAEPLAYRWSSHRDYLGRATVPWVDTAFVLDMFGPAVDIARARYSRFMRTWTDEDLAPFEKHESRDTRAMEPELPARDREQPLPAPVARETLEQIAARHCRRHRIGLTELASPSRERRLCTVRAAIAREALDQHAATLSEVSRFLGRSASVLAQALARQQTTKQK
ncbi:MAG: transposase, partial [Gammaproteobacteria bacterium]|nr:transposase [Gammaproteobacteria bacterium]